MCMQPPQIYTLSLLVMTRTLDNAASLTLSLRSLKRIQRSTFIFCFVSKQHVIQCYFRYPKREVFIAGALDSFIMTTAGPLGDLKYMRVWNDNVGMRDMGAWYCMSITVTDIQTGLMTKFVFDEWVTCDRGDLNVRVKRNRTYTAWSGLFILPD
jgi:hypothetical protein